MERHSNAQVFRDRIFRRLPVLADEGRCRVPNSRFWDFYRANKPLFYDACIGVRKFEDGAWFIVAYDFVDREAAQIREIDEMLSRHNPNCRKCGKPCVIERALMMDDRIFYRFFCEECRTRTGGLLPHVLVKYLWGEEGVEIIDRPNHRQRRKSYEERHD